MATREEVIHRLDINPSPEYAVAIWCVDDVLVRAKEIGIPLTNEQAEAVIRSVDHKQDCTMGISWDVLDVYIEHYFKQYSERG